MSALNPFSWLSRWLDRRIDARIEAAAPDHGALADLIAKHRRLNDRMMADLKNSARNSSRAA